MTAAGKITAAHLERLAIVYVRQSTIAQVREHTESTARQYALAQEAARLGWNAARISIIDADLGVSGRTASARSGFKELVGRVCVGEVGAILGLEVSRLARSSADLQRLLELCALTDTLIIDSDGIYDLGSFNDRLLLGLKGTMSEAELHLLAGRLQGAKLAAAQRGELRFPLPVGYVYDEDGRTVIDLHEEVRAAVADVFASFEAKGSAYAVVAAFAGRRFPTRAYGGVWAGEIRWGRLSHGRVLQLLANPSYAGAYVFGRFRSRRAVDPDGTIRIKSAELPREQWQALIRDHHPAYITWETFLANTKRLAANCTCQGARPVREGGALLQGIILCGGCGRAMSTTCSGGKPIYDCTHSRADHVTTAQCRSVLAEVVDRVVGQRLLEVLAPQEIALALAAVDEVTTRKANRNRALELRVERTRYEAARAERAFHHCDPDNRLVARSLERRWEEKLRELAEAERELACQMNEPALPSRDQLESLAADFPQLWAAPTTSGKERKRLLRSLIGDVTLISEPRSMQLRIGIRWRSGACEELMARRPHSAPQVQRTPQDAIEIARRLGASRTNAELAAELNHAGLKSGTGRCFNVASIQWMRYAYQIDRPQLLAPGELSVKQVAARLGIAPDALYSWISQGQIAVRRAAGGRLCVPFTPEVEQTLRQRIANSNRIRPRTQSVTVGDAV
ncbi:MAG TPA: recombinase family protein [Steroidobacteraceae bacterium]|nr:recombinase family protein [Steroidobacteraceae bacterium]